MLYILSHLSKSAKLLAQELEKLAGEEISVKPHIVNANDNLIIRYGNSEMVQKICEFNNAEHIKLAGNKLRLSEFLKEKDFPHVELEPEKYPNEFPVIIRTELNAGGGIGIKVVEDKETYHLYRDYSWSKWYDFKFELGVHVLGGNIARVFKKVRNEGLEEEKYPIRNSQNGYSFKLRNVEKYRGLPKFVEKLYEIFPIKFARLDIGFSEDHGWKLIEINSAPDLSQNKNTLDMYTNFLYEELFTEV